MRKTKETKITYFSKKAIICPVCASSFYHEDLLSGRGRLIAGELTDELRRYYEPSKKYGAVFPSIYPVRVCPVCYYAAYQTDFLDQKSETATLKVLQAERDKRLSTIDLIFKRVDFTEPRGLEEGTASYILTAMCYDHFDKRYSPTIKQGIATLRAAWLFSDLHRKEQNENYDYCGNLFYRKACFFYSQALEKEQSGQESMGSIVHLGPDLDKNYGYEGVLYIAGLLEYKYGSKNDPDKRIASLDRAKKIVARVHGMGKASKSRPSVILDKAKDLFRDMSNEVKILQGETPRE